MKFFFKFKIVINSNYFFFIIPLQNKNIKYKNVKILAFFMIPLWDIFINYEVQERNFEVRKINMATVCILNFEFFFNESIRAWVNY